MDFFRLLSRGTKLDRSDLFDQTQKPLNKQDDRAIIRELDFFHSHSKDSVSAQAEQVKNNKKAKEKIKTEVPIHKAKISGSDVPEPLGEFEDLQTRFEFTKQQINRIRFEKPTQIQSELIPAILHGRDVLACAPTGSGKTLAYALPVIHQLQQAKPNSIGVLALVLVPTKELATQVRDSMVQLASAAEKSHAIKISILSKSLLARLTDSTDRSILGSVVISTPLRLVRALHMIELDNLQTLILDEADRLFDSTFAEQTDSILAHVRKNKESNSHSSYQKILLSATMPSTIETLGLSLMTTPLRIFISPGKAASTVDQQLIYAGSEEGKLMAIRQMFQTGELPPPILIFVQSIDRANALMHELVYDGINVDVIHGDRTESQRRAIIERFKKAEIWVLICTDVLARGIDVHGVNVVINYDVPQSAQSYIHRIGRTGRAGKLGRAITYFTAADAQSIAIVANVMRESGCKVPAYLSDLAKADKNLKRKLKVTPVEREQLSTRIENLKQAERKKRKLQKQEKQAADQKSKKS
ncbi:P-loop containing nucleoside triphosphate hydrolase protein [Lipomyces oligophaga]|uniref:P-loop containing nucleoside triphosphate hydrolase protein n=1 Tax=Lipomyces oligophaga TaxID=45792 RepID=UPI0034CD2D82